MDSRVLLAVDGNSLVHRSYHAQARTGIRSVDGRPIWAVRGLLSQLVSAVDRVGPDAVLVGFDDPVTSLRRTQWPQYKAARTDKLDTLVEQLALAVEVLRQIGVAVVVPDGLEADDVLASAARFAPTAGATTVIMTSDRDAFALIDAHTRVLRIVNGGVEASPMLTAERLAMMLGVRPDQYRDYAALRGDSSDNLPGVVGIGPKTAAKLLASLGSARAAFDDLAVEGGRVADAIGAVAATRLTDPAARAAWELNCRVMAMHDDVPLGLRFEGGPGVLPFDATAVRSAFADHQLTWTTAAALRVLARDETAAAAPVRQAWTEPPAEGWPRPPRPARLAPVARTEQLALFDMSAIRR